MSAARSLANSLLLQTEEVFNTVAKAIIGQEAAGTDWQWALIQDAAATSIINKQTREEFLKQAAEQYDGLIAARDKFNENSPYPICPGCGMRHEPHGDEEIPRTTH